MVCMQNYGNSPITIKSNFYNTDGDILCFKMQK